MPTLKACPGVSQGGVQSICLPTDLVNVDSSVTYMVCKVCLPWRGFRNPPLRTPMSPLSNRNNSARAKPSRVLRLLPFLMPGNVLPCPAKDLFSRAQFISYEIVLLSTRLRVAFAWHRLMKLRCFRNAALTISLSFLVDADVAIDDIVKSSPGLKAWQ